MAKAGRKSPSKRVQEAHGSKADSRVRGAHTPGLHDQGKTYQRKQKREQIKKGVRKVYT